MSKYHSKKIVIDGITFASQKEGGRYLELKLLQKAGVIESLEIQPKFVLIEAGVYKGKKYRKTEYWADFAYTDVATGAVVVEDSKGFKTPVYKLKYKMLISRYPMIDFREV